MVEDLYDSEIKLSKLLQQYRSQESEVIIIIHSTNNSSIKRIKHTQ